jgi:hypothetical protein
MNTRITQGIVVRQITSGKDWLGSRRSPAVVHGSLDPVIFYTQIDSTETDAIIMQYNGRQ